MRKPWRGPFKGVWSNSVCFATMPTRCLKQLDDREDELPFFSLSKSLRVKIFIWKHTHFDANEIHWLSLWVVLKTMQRTTRKWTVRKLPRKFQYFNIINLIHYLELGNLKTFLWLTVITIESYHENEALQWSHCDPNTSRTYYFTSPTAYISN